MMICTFVLCATPHTTQAQTATNADSLVLRQAALPPDTSTVALHICMKSGLEQRITNVRGVLQRSTRFTAPAVRLLMAQFGLKDEQVSLTFPEADTTNRLRQNNAGGVYARQDYSNFVTLRVPKSAASDVARALSRVPEVWNVSVGWR